MGRFNLSDWGIRHPQLLAFLILVIGLSGAFAYSRLGRAEDPAFTIKTAVVSVEWPGATTAEMQAQVADRDREEAAGTALDRQDRHLLQARLRLDLARISATRRRRAKCRCCSCELRKKMSDLLPDLPAGVLGPFVNDEFGDVDSVLYTIVGDGASYAQLKDVAEAFRKRLQRVPDVTKVDLYGDQAGAHFRRVQPRQARHARRPAAGPVRFDRQAERAYAPPANSRPTRSACRCG